MKKTITILCVILMVGSAFAERKVWTGEGGYRWNNPDSWNPPGVPGYNDDVEIPEDSWCTIPFGSPSVRVNSLVNNGNLTASSAPIFVKETIVNNATMKSEASLNVVSHDGVLENSGTMTANKVGIYTKYFNNYTSGTVEGKGVGHATDDPYHNCGVEISSYQASNWGDIKTTHASNDGEHGPQIRISGSQFNNQRSGKIRAGHGGPHGNGGNVDFTGGRFNNWGEILAGDGGNGGNGGTIKIYCKLTNVILGKLRVGDAGYGGIPGDVSIIGPAVEITGGIKGGEFDRKGSTYIDHFGSDLVILGDSIEIFPEDSIIQTDFITVVGRIITVHDVNNAEGLHATSRIEFLNSTGGSVDFSGVHVTDAISGWPGDAWIWSDSIIPPPEGLEEIFIPNPLIAGYDTSIIGGSIIAFHPSTGDTSDTDTLRVFVYNLSTTPQVLDYSVSSAWDWFPRVTGSTAILAPFVMDSFEIVYAIPDSAISQQEDTITITLDIIPDFSDTLHSYITIVGGIIEDTLLHYEYNLVGGWNLLSYPFGDPLPLLDAFPYYIAPGYGYDTEIGTYYSTDTVVAGMGFWSLISEDNLEMVVSFTEMDTIHYNFTPGWNLMGTSISSIPASALEGFPEVLMPLFGYDPILRSYFIADTLYPGFGYWILSLDTLEFTLPE